LDTVSSASKRSWTPNVSLLQKLLDIFSAFSLESNALKGPLWLARWLPQKLGGGST